MKERALRFSVYGAIGVAAGLVAALLDYVTIEIILDAVVELPIGFKLLFPGFGLVLTAGILRWPGLRSPTGTSEEFIRAYHDRNDRLRLRYLPARLAAGMTTVGFGGAMGLEGPAIYAGSTIGASMQTRMRGLFADKDKRMLMVAGAAAGVAAIFKTPATVVLFALEVPYQGDVARRALLPALIASSTAYITFVTVTFNNDPIFLIRRINQADNFVSERAAREIVVAVLIGLLAGFGAALMARAVKEAKKIEAQRPWWHRALAASATLGLLIVITEVFYD
ncbi:MAG: chloride channel protein, partial [Acidimicrobiales bacterium]